MRVQKSKCPLQKVEQFRHRMFRRGAQLDQFNKIGSRLGATIALPDPSKGTKQDCLGQCMQTRSAAALDLDFRLEKKIELARKNALWPARAFRDGLNAAQRLCAPGDDRAGVAQFALAQKNGVGCFHHPFFRFLLIWNREKAEEGGRGRLETGACAPILFLSLYAALPWRICWTRTSPAQ